MRRFEEFQTLRQETTDLCQALKDRKIIERAKGILMKKEKFDEEVAFGRVEKSASSNNQKLVEVAHMIVSVADILYSGEDE